MWKEAGIKILFDSIVTEALLQEPHCVTQEVWPPDQVIICDIPSGEEKPRGILHGWNEAREVWWE